MPQDSPVSNRKLAHLAGLPTYLADKPCIHGHEAVRYTKTGQCKQCVALNNKRWQQSFGRASVHPDAKSSITFHGTASQIQAIAIAWRAITGLAAPATPQVAPVATPERIAFDRNAPYLPKADKCKSPGKNK